MAKILDAAGLRAARAAAYERARPEILEHIPATARRVLDLGCATGTTGAALKARQDAHVTGIEIEAEYAREAATVLDRVIGGDAATPPEDLGTFDTLIAADILEHLIDPWATLSTYARHLEPGATAVISLPNVGHWSTYAYLARGRWPRKPEGIFDATHLRWFTRRDAVDLHPARRAPRPSWSRSSHDRAGVAGCSPAATRLDRLAPPLTLFTFQHVLAANYCGAHMPVSDLSRIFKAYDVRGIYGSDIDGDTAEAVGRGLARALADLSGKPRGSSGSASDATCACRRPNWRGAIATG